MCLLTHSFIQHSISNDVSDTVLGSSVTIMNHIRTELFGDSCGKYYRSERPCGYKHR